MSHFGKYQQLKYNCNWYYRNKIANIYLKKYWHFFGEKALTYISKYLTNAKDKSKT